MLTRFWFCVIVCATACDTTAAAKKKADAAIEGTKDAIDESTKAIEKTKQTAEQLGDEAAEKKKKAEQLYAEVTDTGRLSQRAKSWIEAEAKDQGGTIESVIMTGTQIAPVALEVGKVLNDTVQTDTAVEPIYQKIEGDPAQVDAAIEKMPRVEVIDGITVGFRQLDAVEVDKAVKERAYLVTWRREDHLIGFVYRSTRTIDIDKLVAETPRLVKLTQTALDDAG